VKRLPLILAGCLGAACGPQVEPVKPPPPATTGATSPPVVSAAPLVSAVPSAEPTAVASAEPSAAPVAPPPPAPPPIPPNTIVLNFGDSFLQAGFYQTLKPKFAELAVKYEVRAEQSTYTVTWAGKTDLLVKQTLPDLVIINIGANELSNTDPPTHAKAVRKIIAGVGDRPCVWVSPPSWKKDTGILDVIRLNSPPCRFFDSDEHVKEPIPRQSDHIHPNKEGGRIWAEAFWKWLMSQRAPAEPAAPGTKVNPWKLLPAPPEEHQAKDKPKEKPVDKPKN
jgi:hypothetical protein